MRGHIFGAALVAAPLMAAEITTDDLGTLPVADVIFLGEVHDNLAHHMNQRAAMLEIKPAAVVYEMLTEAQAAQMPPVLPNEDDLRALLDWDNSGWPDFTLYYPVFSAAPDALVFGAAMPRDELRALRDTAITTIFGADAGTFGLTTPLAPHEQMDREALKARAHCDMLPETMLPMMVDIQRLRDAMLARAALQAFEQTGGPVVVITGTEHARTDWGAPATLRFAAPDLRQLSIGQFEARPEAAPPHDLWLVAEPPDRADPCDAFR